MIKEYKPKVTIDLSVVLLEQLVHEFIKEFNEVPDKISINEKDFNSDWFKKVDNVIQKYPTKLKNLSIVEGKDLPERHIMASTNHNVLYTVLKE